MAGFGFNDMLRDDAALFGEVLGGETIIYWPAGANKGTPIKHIIVVRQKLIVSNAIGIGPMTSGQVVPVLEASVPVKTLEKINGRPPQRGGDQIECAANEFANSPWQKLPIIDIFVCDAGMMILKLK